MLLRDKNVIGHRVENPSSLRGRLSPRQLEVLDGILTGKPSRLIAQDLVLSTRTVEAHRAAIMSKVGVSSVAELVRATSKSHDGADNLEWLGRLYPGLVSYWDDGLVVRFVNSRHEALFGISADEIVGKGMEELLGASNFRHSVPFVQGVLGGKAQHFTQVIRMASGQTTTFCSVYAPLFGALGAVEGFFAFMIDTEAPSDHARVVGRESADASPWAEMILDEESRIVSINEEFTNITQFRWNEVRGQTPNVIRPVGVDITSFMRFWADIQAERSWEGTVWYRRHDGYLFRSRQQVTADKTGRGQVGCRVVFNEIKIRGGRPQIRSGD